MDLVRSRPTQPFWVVAPGDENIEPESEQTRFLMRPLTARERARTLDRLSMDGVNTTLFDIFRDHLVEIAGPNKADLPWPSDDVKVRADTMEKIPDSVILGVADQTLGKSTHGEQEKNS